MKPARSLRRWLPSRFGWREGNHFELLVDGACYFAQMLAAINNAQQRIELEMYLVQSGSVFSSFRDALIAAAQRGVSIRVLLDGYGSQGLHAADREALQHAGIQLAIYNELRWHKGLRNLFRDHRKLLLIDARLAFVGGTGLSDDFLPTMHTPGWHEVMLRIQGPVVNDWLTLFERVWRRVNAPRRRHRAALTQAVAGNSPGRVCASSGLRGHHVTRSLYQQIRRSQSRVWLATPYFLPTWTLRYLLKAAARRGLDVRVLLPGEHSDHPAVQHVSRRHYGGLLKRGVRIFEYQPRFIHAKLALCDQWLSLGSTNFDRWNLHWNLDANQEVRDPLLAMQAEQLFLQNFSHSREITLQAWQQRAWRQRLLETVSSWLERLSRMLRRTP